MKFKMTITVEYEASLEHYSNPDDPAACAQEDESSFGNDIDQLMAFLEDQDYEVTIEPQEKTR